MRRGRWWVPAVVVAGALGAALPAAARVDLAPHIQDQMVVQRGAPWEVSGTTDAGESFSVEFLGQKRAVRPAGGAWNVRFEVPPDALGPAELSIPAARVSRKVMVGDVWLCSGQSNMVFAAARATDGEEILRAVAGRPIAMLQVPKPRDGQEPQAAVWVPASSTDHARRFSAVCLAFGASLHEMSRAPTGLIDASLAGTGVESWISAQSFRQLPSAPAARERYAARKKERAARGRAAAGFGKDEPSRLFDLMVRPLGSQAIKGVFWYQGESNRENGASYAEPLKALMQDWRSHWHNPALLFVVMQLPAFGAAAAGMEPASAWAAVRDAQRLVVMSSPPAGLVVSLGLGDGRLHPGAKQAFGRRAAEVAFELMKEPGSAATPPLPIVMAADGNAMRVEFGGGRACVEPTAQLARAVYVAGGDRRWHIAEARVSGSSLIASSPLVARPAAVRYAWADHPPIGLRSCGGGVPVTPFRSDQWPLDSMAR